MAKGLIRSRGPAAVAVAGGDESMAGQAVLEFQSPTLTLVSQPVPLSTRMTTWLISSFVVASIVIFGVIPVDRLVSSPAILIAQSPNVIVQPLETAIVRRILVHEGEHVKKGQLLAELDPTFAVSDEKASAAQMASLQAQVSRMKAELAGKPYVSDGSQYGQLEEMAYLQHHQQYVFTLDNYDQRIAAQQAKVQQAQDDVASLTRQLAKLTSVEQIRKQLERMQVGSKLNTFQAELDRETGQQKLADAQQTLIGAKRDLDGMIAERDSWKHKWFADLQTQESELERSLSNMRGEQAKNELRRKLVDMRAPEDSIVLSVSRVAPGTVLQSGVELMTTVPEDSPLEVVAMIDGGTAGFVKPGDKVSIKFDTLPYFRYGYALGHVARISADSFTDPQEGLTNPQATSPNISANSPANNGSGHAYYYRAFVTIDQMKLRHPPSSFSLKPGMPLQVDINVGHRTVLQYFFDQFMPVFTEGANEPT